MSIWDAFGKGRYKGFSREAGQLLDKAVELAGGLGCKGRHRPPAVGDAAGGRRPGGPLSGREEHHGAGSAASAVRRAGWFGHQACPGRYGGGPASDDGLRHHRGAERPPEPGRAGASALRHAGRHRLRCGRYAGIHGVQLTEAVRSAASFQGSSSCLSSRARRRRCRGAAGPATNTAAI